MLLRSIAAPLISVKGIGPALLPRFARLGITNLAGLLTHYPREWEDRSVRVPIAEFHRAPVCTEVTVISRDWIRGGGRLKSTLKVYVRDETGTAALVCFNRPWMEKQLVPGGRFRLWGVFRYRYGDIQSAAFELEPAGAENRSPGILPVYPLTAGLTQSALRRFVALAVEEHAAGLEDELPPGIPSGEKTLSKSAAIRAVHFPASMEELELAKNTLKYEELFYLEVMIAKRALARKTGTRPPRGGSEPGRFPFRRCRSA